MEPVPDLGSKSLAHEREATQLYRSRLQVLSDLIGDFVVYVNETFHIVSLSGQSKRYLGVDEETLRNNPPKITDLVEQADAVASALKLAYQQTEPVAVEFQLRTLDGSSLWISAKVNTVPARSAPQLVIVGHDITQRKADESALRHMATHDTLTGLPNRALLAERIAFNLANAQRNGVHFALMLLDLDGFKRINDTLGHRVGDELLISTASRLSTLLRATDMVARLGGDEFVLLLGGHPSVDDVSEVARRVLALVQQPFFIGGNTLHVTTSIGGALFPTHGTDEITLLKNADAAMYQAKDAGKNKFRVYTGMGDSLTALSIEAALYAGVERGEFLLHYQPITTPEGVMVGFEALMRWNRNGEGLVPPAVFIPIAENTGLVELLGAWALRAACAQAQRINQNAVAPVYVTVNVSPRQFQSAPLLRQVQTALEESGLPPELLVLEITEGTLMHDHAHSKEVLNALTKMGVRVAVDDFGTGYSSLAYLKHFPLSVLKIDRSFIKELATDGSDLAIVSAVIGLASALNLKVVAEGVENSAQLDILRSKQCAYIQGWLMSKALPGDDLLQYHQQQRDALPLTEMTT